MDSCLDLSANILICDIVSVRDVQCKFVYSLFFLRAFLMPCGPLILYCGANKKNVLISYKCVL